MPISCIRQALARDADLLGRIGPVAYLAAYDYLWDSPAALAEQLATFSADAFAKLLARLDARVWIAETDGKAVGFMSLIVNSPSPVNPVEGGAEIPRIYLLPAAQGTGLGWQLLNVALEHARIQGRRYVWLDVMASASQAIAAYRRWGFVETGRKQFKRPVRAGLGEMMVFEKHIAGPQR